MPAPSPKSRPRGASTYVALLRGINVGGRHMLPMADLTRMFEHAGCRAVRTYIQSGNVIFTASAAVAKRVPDAVAEQIGRRFGFRPSIVLRSGAEIATVAQKHPFLEKRIEPKALYVGFLDGAPTAAAIARLDPKRSPGDRFLVRGREIYVHYGNGFAETKLTGAYVDARLAMQSTFRNWNTVLRLAEMTRPS